MDSTGSKHIERVDKPIKRSPIRTKKPSKSHYVKKVDESELLTIDDTNEPSRIQKREVKSHQPTRVDSLKEKKRQENDYNYSLEIAYQYLDKRPVNTTLCGDGLQPSNTNNNTTSICNHTNTINKDDMIICVDCGETIEEEICEEAEWRYYGANDNVESADPSRCQYRTVVDKGITKDLLSIGFSVDVSNKANELYLIVTKGDIKRSNYRKGIMFACVFYAFIALGKPQTTEYIRKIFKIDKRIVSKGFTYYGLEMPKDKREQYVYITAEHYIPKILKELKITEDHVDNVLTLYNKVKNKSYLLNTSNPQSIASGFVYYYLRKLNVDISPSKFRKVESVNLSEITITRISNEIEEIITSDDMISLKLY
jgi:transcription initiation factor TFIIIB Brf1 subunit/transcription initiation factor TFIIB